MEKKTLTKLLANLTAKTPSRVEWEHFVTAALANRLQCSTSDAQAVIDAQSAILDASWEARDIAAEVAAKMEAASAVPAAETMPMSMRQYADRVIALLRTQPPGTGLQDGDSGGEFFMDGEGLYACQIDEARADGAIDLDEDAWDSARGCWDGSTPEETMAVIESPVFLPSRGGIDS
jgi:hypothetical protein